MTFKKWTLQFCSKYPIFSWLENFKKSDLFEEIFIVIWMRHFKRLWYTVLHHSEQIFLGFPATTYSKRLVVVELPIQKRKFFEATLLETRHIYQNRKPFSRQSIHIYQWIKNGVDYWKIAPIWPSLLLLSSYAPLDVASSLYNKENYP